MKSCRRLFVTVFIIIAEFFSLSIGKSVSKTSNRFSLGSAAALPPSKTVHGIRTVRLNARFLLLGHAPGEVQRFAIADIRGRIIADASPGKNETCCWFPRALKPGCYAVVLMTAGAAATTSTHVVMQ